MSRRCGSSARRSGTRHGRLRGPGRPRTREFRWARAWRCAIRVPAEAHALLARDARGSQPSLPPPRGSVPFGRLHRPADPCGERRRPLSGGDRAGPRAAVRAVGRHQGLGDGLAGRGVHRVGYAVGGARARRGWWSLAVRACSGHGGSPRTGAAATSDRRPSPRSCTSQR